MQNGKSLLTIKYRLGGAECFLHHLRDERYYFFVGNHKNSNTVLRPYDNPQDTLLSVYYNMIFGKKISSNDVHLSIRRVDWESGVVYDVYDHRTENLYSDDFYVVIKEGTQYDVFKCLENGNGAPSTVAPSRTNVSVDSEDFFYPTDGYRWKYMYSITEAEAIKFSTPDYFPVTTDVGVKAHAVKGAIDVIKVEDAGKGYANYIDGVFKVGDVRLNGDGKIYAISNSEVKTANGFYDGCWIYISSGSGAGQYRMIESYTSNSTYNFIELNEPFDLSDLPQNGSTYEITPSLNIAGDGAETVEAKARAIIDPEGNTVSRIEMLDRGKNYNLAAATIRAAASVGVTANAEVTPIYSPYGGHGSDSPAELGAKYVSVGVKLSGNESNTVITDNDYSQIGILKNPDWRNIRIELDNQNRDFNTNEYVYKIETKQLHGTVTTIKNGNNELTTGLTMVDSTPSELVSVGDTIMIHSGTNYQVAEVATVSANTITINAAASFDTGTGEANLYYVDIVGQGLVDGFSAGFVTLTDANTEFSVGDIVIGAETGTYGTVASYKITDHTKGFGTFMQVHTYVGSVTQGVFQSDERVYQTGNEIASGYYHSIANDPVTGTKRIYVTNQVGIFNTAADDLNMDDEIKGQTSGAIASLTNKYLPDLVFGSGEIIYVENGDSITRAAEQSETFKLIIEF